MQANPREVFDLRQSPCVVEGFVRPNPRGRFELGKSPWLIDMRRDLCELIHVKDFSLGRYLALQICRGLCAS